MKKIIQAVLKDSGPVPRWNDINPFWRLFILVGFFLEGWGLNDVVHGHVADGVTAMLIGLICLTFVWLVIEEVVQGKNNDPDTSQDE